MEITNEAQKRLDDFCKAVSKATKTFIKVIRQLIDWVQKLVIRISNYPNRKVVYLALYAKKKRVRQKNRNRIINDMFKGW